MEIDLATSLQECLNAEAERKAKPRPIDKRKNFWASEIGKCARQTYYWKTGETPLPHKAEVIMRMRGGNLWHDEVRRMWAEMFLGVTFYGNVKEARHEETVSVQLDEQNDVDVTFVYRTDGAFLGTTLLEVKSFGDFSFKKFNSSTDKVAYLQTMKDYWIQCHFMAGQLGMKQIQMVPINRDNGQVGFKSGTRTNRAVSFAFDPGVHQAALKRCATIQNSIQQREPPDREYDEHTWQCRGCGFRKICRPKEDDEKIVTKRWIPKELSPEEQLYRAEKESWNIARADDKSLRITK